MTTENHSGSIPLLDMGVGPVCAQGEESNVSELNLQAGRGKKRGSATIYKYDDDQPAEWSLDEVTRIRLRSVPSGSVPMPEWLASDLRDMEVAAFAKRVRLPGSAFVARQFGRLEAWKAARVERQAQAAFARGWV